MNAENTSRKHSLSRGNIVLICLFAVYAVLTFIGAANHEIWYDEAQAWCIARDNDIPGIIAQMQYEGHPPLWHFVLYPFTRLGFSADILPFISWFITLISAGLMLWKAPFRPLAKGIILFSGGFLFYWSVTSRVYCILVLVLVLLAIVYKNRSRFPVVYGILVAILANTHIMMCGLVGILGIFMIIDLFKLWKSSKPSDNARKIIGLLIAGAGVICLVLPLLGSFKSVNIGNSNTISPGYAVSKIYNSFPDIMEGILMDGNRNLPLHSIRYLIRVLYSICLILALILLRHYKRSLIIHTVFAAFFITISEIMWFMIPTRAFIFLFMFVFVFWLALDTETPVVHQHRPVASITSPKLKKALEQIRQADLNFKHWYMVIICFVCVSSVPMGGFILVSDIFSDYSQSKKAAEYIRENLPSGSVLVVKNELFSQYSAYLPEYRFYSINYNSFVTYSFETKPEKNEVEKDSSDIDCEQVYQDLKDFDNVYFLDFSMISPLPDDKIIYRSENSLLGSGNQSDTYVNISKFDIEDIK